MFLSIFLNKNYLRVRKNFFVYFLVTLIGTCIILRFFIAFVEIQSNDLFLENKSTNTYSADIHLLCTHGHFQMNLLSWIQLHAIEMFINYNKIFLHVFNEPENNYWFQQFGHKYTVSYHHKANYTNLASGVKVEDPAHMSDLLRFDMMCEYGGMYLDLDEIPIRPLHKFFEGPADITLGRQSEGGIAIGFMIAKYSHSEFFCDLASQSKEVFDRGWTTHSIELITEYLTKPVSIHIEPQNTFYPLSWQVEDLELMYDLDALPVSWDHTYAIHMWSHALPENLTSPSVEEILSENRNFFHAIRHIVNSGLQSGEIKKSD
eukprot:gb/GECH01014216.1/.p1 GENE.gb/GECH01014216.1/~~gb/GECH01014216.1/.p1  ORF type:complete len:318 (+),score=44.49 gb/GECH01014216.1/:1-954(+)